MKCMNCERKIYGANDIFINQGDTTIARLCEYCQETETDSVTKLKVTLARATADTLFKPEQYLPIETCPKKNTASA